MNLLNFFKKKSDNKVDLEKAKAEGLITEEEFLELKIKRAQKELKEFQTKNIKKGVSK
ncbi:unnamed protein product [marine sediment metagenome]|uniref:SHOCT domain-containing protein n=1 Tax=marine sediment metagenome TaxID=412755 RepID=X1KIK0_9ZZZZ